MLRWTSVPKGRSPSYFPQAFVCSYRRGLASGLSERAEEFSADLADGGCPVRDDMVIASDTFRDLRKAYDFVLT